MNYITLRFRKVCKFSYHSVDITHLLHVKLRNENHSINRPMEVFIKSLLYYFAIFFVYNNNTKILLLVQLSFSPKITILALISILCTKVIFHS
jgi:hypothetical protein